MFTKKMKKRDAVGSGFFGFAAVAVIFGILTFTLGSCGQGADEGPKKAATPVAYPPGGSYSSTQNVMLVSATDGAVIYYTTNGNTPTTSSAVFTSAIAISISTPLKAIAVHKDMANSKVLTAMYTMPYSEQAASPTANPTGGTYSGTQLVTLSSATEGAAIYYTTDGSTPTTGSVLYSGTISVSVTTTLRAVAVKEGMADSVVMIANYNITNPDMGPLTEVKWLEILQGVESNSTFNGTLDLSYYSRSDSTSGAGLRSNGTFDPGNTVSIGKGKITSIILPTSATEIAGGTSSAPAFRHFTVLESFSGTMLSTIGAYAFAGCTELAEISLPSGITSIGNEAFLGCTGLREVTLTAATPPALGTNVFGAIRPTLAIRVPADKVDAYRAAAGWNTYAGIILAIGVTPVITIETQPKAATNVIMANISGSLSLGAEVTEGVMLWYQWYRNTEDSNVGGTAVAGATGASRAISTTLAAGTYYYYCEIRAVAAVLVLSTVAAVNVNNIDIMVMIPAGNFTMGSPTTETNRDTDETEHQVTLSAFKIGKYQVTQDLYLAVMETNPSSFSSSPTAGEVQGRRPVETVSWYDALVFCNKLSIMEGLSPVYSISGSTDPAAWGIVPISSNSTWNAAIVVSGSTGYRLPTEAQWEYACRAGTTTAYNTGDTISNDTGWYLSNSNSRTHEVGKKPANAWGLYDMHGNVYEWCWDWYGSSYPSTPETDPVGPNSGAYRVRRGGGWSSDALNARSAYRYSGDPRDRGSFIGFRLVCP